MRIETVQRPLRELVRDFTTGKILLPQFQRDYVWKPKKIRNLLDSLLQQYPVGGFYLWRPAGGALDPKPKKFANGGPIVYAQFAGYLIDGQQRLTSLEAAFQLYSGEDKNGSELRCFLDLTASRGDEHRDTRLFVTYGGRQSIARRVDDSDPTLIPVSQFFEKIDKQIEKEQDAQLEESLKELGWKPARVQGAIVQLDAAREMLDQEVPCTTVYEVSDSQAVEVFSRLNKGGTPLRQGDVTAAGLARGKAVSVLTAMREFVSTERPQRLGLSFSFAFRALVVFHRGSAQFLTLKPDWMDVPGPDGRSLHQSWKAAQKALEESLLLADKTMGWSSRTLLPSLNALIVLAAALDRADFKVNDADQQLLKRWLCLTALRGTFQGSVESTINRFLKGMRESKRRPAEALVGALHKDEARPVRADEFRDTTALWASQVQIMHALFVGRESADWLDGTKTIDELARTDLAKFPGGDLTVHHIFPRKVVLETCGTLAAANRPANFALLSRSTNSEFGSKRPEDVLAALGVDERKRAAKQFFGQAAGDRLAVDKYEDFCDWRAKCVAEAVNEFLGMD